MKIDEYMQYAISNNHNNLILLCFIILNTKKENKITISLSNLSSLINIKKNTIVNGLKSLKNEGFIEVEGGTKFTTIKMHQNFIQEKANKKQKLSKTELAYNSAIKLLSNLD